MTNFSESSLTRRMVAACAQKVLLRTQLRKQKVSPALLSQNLKVQSV